MRKFLIICLSLLFISNTSFSQDSDERWEYIGQDGQKAKYYRDVFNLFVKEDVFGVKQVWIKVVQPKYSMKRGNKTYTYYNVVSKHLYEIKCGSQEMRLKQYADYTAEGKLIVSNELFESFEKAVPESMGEFIMSKFCLR
jgi:hypothetical protein